MLTVIFVFIYTSLFTETLLSDTLLQLQKHRREKCIHPFCQLVNRFLLSLVIYRYNV